MKLTKVNLYQGWKDAEEKNQKTYVKSFVKILVSGLLFGVAGKIFTDGLYEGAQAEKTIEIMEKLEDMEFSTIEEDNTEESEG